MPLATGRYLGEGFDDARLDTLFLTLPVSWRGTIAQYAGRLHRLREGKRDVRIYDYVDAAIPMAVKMHERRCGGYRALSYAIEEAAPLFWGYAVLAWCLNVAAPPQPRTMDNGPWTMDHGPECRASGRGRSRDLPCLPDACFSVLR